MLCTARESCARVCEVRLSASMPPSRESFDSGERGPLTHAHDSRENRALQLTSHY